jgi:hypothetical protein
LVDGASYAVYVLGKNSGGIWQTSPNATRTWQVDTSYSRLVINELLAWTQSALENTEAHPDLVELYYDGPYPLDLSGMSLTDDAGQPMKFVFPQGTAMEPGQHLVLFADVETAFPGIHLAFSLDKLGGTIQLYDTSGGLLDSVEYGAQLPDLSVGRVGAQGVWRLTTPTFGQSNVAHPLGDPAAVRINEWLARGEVLSAEGFIELFNPQSPPVDIGGFRLTSDPATGPQGDGLAPLTFIAAQGFTLFTGGSQSLPGPAGLELSMDGGVIALLDGESHEVDKIVYGPQTADVSQGRSPDGSSTLEFFTLPTPGAPNPVTIPPGPAIKNLIAIDSTWSYEQSGVPLDASWCEPVYADSLWPTGRAALYMEDAALPGPKNTRLTLGPSTFYFRTHFFLDAAPENVTLLELTALIDDGAVFYLNGREVYRLGMPAGAIGYVTQAGRTVGNATLEGPFEIPTSDLRRGDNVLAVEVHQSSAGSSDVVFGLELDAHF